MGKMYYERIQTMLARGIMDDALVEDIRGIQVDSHQGYRISQDILGCLTELDRLNGIHNNKWILMARLIDWGKFYQKDITRILVRAFMAYNPDATEARMHVLRAILNAGHKFYPVDLASLPFKSIRVEYPELWINAWVYSCVSSSLPATLEKIRGDGENVVMLTALYDHTVRNDYRAA